MGIEQSFNKFLTGKTDLNLVKKIIMDIKFHLVIAKKSPQNGDNVHTTINPSLQLLLENQMNKAQQEANPKSMNAILMMPKLERL